MSQVPAGSEVAPPSSYFLPANAIEAERLMSQHLVLIDELGGRIVLAPIDLVTMKSGLTILDSGTADGHWISELRKTLPDPSAHRYVGTDINPALFPRSLPHDTRFQVQNIAHTWPREFQDSFDLVHQRLTLPGAAPAASLPEAVRGLFGLVKPGGWIQLVEAEQEGGAPGESGPVFHEFLDLVRALFEATGAGWRYAREMRGWLEDAGAVDVDECVVGLRFGANNPDEKMAALSATSTAKAMDGLVKHAKMASNIKTDLSIEQLDTLGDRLLDELMTRGARYQIRCVWGRKKNIGEAW